MKIPETAQELIWDFLPNRQFRWNEWTRKRCHDKSRFVEYYYSEALTAFAEAVAKEQRELCKMVVDELIDSDKTEEIYIGDAELICKSIFSAPSPITKE